MTEKRFTITQDFEEHHRQIRDNGHIIMGCFIEPQAEVIVDLLNTLHEENEELKNRLKDWHQKTFEAHEYFNILEKIIDEVCDDDISNQIWKEYEKREKLIE